jgi:hypothetical protein
MDEETKNYLDNMMVQLNGQFERILDRLTLIQRDSETTRAHVLYGLQENLTLSQRISRLEEFMPKAVIRHIR